jgi:hypothetical protein
MTIFVAWAVAGFWFGAWIKLCGEESNMRLFPIVSMNDPKYTDVTNTIQFKIHLNFDFLFDRKLQNFGEHSFENNLQLDPIKKLLQNSRQVEIYE